MTCLRSGGHHGRVDLDGFARDGYVAVRGAVDAGTVAACRELTWAAMERRGVRRDEHGSWPPLMQGMDDLAGEPFTAAYTAPALTAAYDELIGPGRWSARCARRTSARRSWCGSRPRTSGPTPDTTSRAATPAPDGPARLGEHPVPRPRAAGSVPVHRRRPPRRAHPAAMRLAPGRPAVPGTLRRGGHRCRRRVLAAIDPVLTAAHATGRAGDVFLCHPFIVHTATWPHRGAGPRMIAQPAVNAPPASRSTARSSPVAQAIVRAWRWHRLARAVQRRQRNPGCHRPAGRGGQHPGHGPGRDPDRS